MSVTFESKMSKSSCKLCKRRVVQDGIQCDGLCSGWYHAQCVNLTKDDLGLMEKLGPSKTFWLCNEDKALFRKWQKDEALVLEVKEDFKKAVDSKVAELEVKIDRMSETLEAIKYTPRTSNVTYADACEIPKHCSNIACIYQRVGCKT